MKSALQKLQQSKLPLYPVCQIKGYVMVKRFIHWQHWKEDEAKGPSDLACLLDTDMSFWVKHRNSWAVSKKYVIIAVLVEVWCMCVYISHLCLVPLEARIHQIPWNRSYRWFWATMWVSLKSDSSLRDTWMLGIKLDSFERQPVLLAAEPSSSVDSLLLKFWKTT